MRTKDKSGDPAQRGFNLREDVARLEQEIIRCGNVRLVIIDPISAYLGETDSHNNADMRGVLAPLSAMAAKHGVAVVLVTHLNKSQEQEPIARVIGSIGLIAAARAGFAVVRDQKNPKVRYFLPLKNNIGNDEDGFAFQIEEVDIPHNFGAITTSRVAWLPGMVQAKDILNPDEQPKPTQTNGAKAFLEGMLKDGPRLASEIFEEAENGAGYSKAAVQRASQALEVVKKKQGMDGGWEWSLPLADFIRNHSKPAEDVEGCEDDTDFVMTPFGKKPRPSEG